MNARLRNTPDGSGSWRRSEVVWFDVMRVSTSGSQHTEHDFGEIYWPFALVYKVSAEDDRYDVVHLPSGYCVVGRGITRRRARRLIDQLRALDVDWHFTRPRGRKWLDARDKARAIVKAAAR